MALPGFNAGPIRAGGTVDQELRLSERDVAIRIWLGPAAGGGERARVRIELLAGPHGPSLRSGVIDAPSEASPIVARLVPPLRTFEIGDDGLTLLRLAPVAGSPPIRVWMAQGKAYPPGRSFINGNVLPDHQDVMFEVARELSPGDIWAQVWTQVHSETLPVRAAAVAAGIAVAAGVTAGLAARGRRTRTALIVGGIALAATALVVVDRTSLSLFPGPDFGPTVILR